MSTAVANPAEALATPVRAAASPFISTPGKDLFFYFFSVSVVFIVWFAAGVMHVKSDYILAAVGVTCNGPHLISTWTRTYFDKREWKTRPFPLIGGPILIGAGVFCATYFLGYTGSRLLNSAILYWATWHFVAQNWGILRIYQRKSGEPIESQAMKLERPLLFLWVLWCLLHRIYTGPRVLFGTEVFYFDLPRPIVDGLLGPIAFLFIVYLRQRIKERHQPWARAAWLRAAFLGCAVLGFYIPFQWIKTDDTSAFAAAAAWHAIQYLGIVRFYHRNTWRSGVDSNAKIVSWLGQPGYSRAALYFAMLLALAGFVYVIIYTVAWIEPVKGWNFFTWVGVVWISLTLSHYWLDGVIWKLRKPELAQRVGIDVKA
jgi:hypothetical protein